MFTFLIMIVLFALSMLMILITEPTSSRSDARKALPESSSSAPLRTSRTVQSVREKAIEISNIEINEEFQMTLDLIERGGESLFVTGKAGTGKSTLLRYFRATTRKSVIVLAPTGVAAIHVGGQTIHSFFEFDPNLIATVQDIEKSRHPELFRQLDTIIIDELSMVRPDMMDRIDRSLRLNRENDAPFGGVQMVLIGDLYQLAPVVKEEKVWDYIKSHYGSRYFFRAKVFQGMNLKYIDLQTIYRQEDGTFIDVLNKIRVGKIDPAVLNLLNSRVMKRGGPCEDDSYIALTTTNAAAHERNQRFLDQLPGMEQRYEAVITGQVDPSSFPAESELKLKEGARVMMTKNDPDKRWVNGTFGTVSSLRDGKIIVDTDSGSYEVEKEIWEEIEYESDPEENRLEGKVVGTFEQYPLRLGWAITIHESQGRTFEKVLIDLRGGAFEHGQTYVALSRCTSLEGIALRRRIHARDIKVDHRVSEFKIVFSDAFLSTDERNFLARCCSALLLISL